MVTPGDHLLQRPQRVQEHSPRSLLLTISVLVDGVRAEQQARFKYGYLKNLRAELNNHEDEVLESRKEVREAKRARRETAANRPREVQLEAGDVGELSGDEEDLR